MPTVSFAVSVEMWSGEKWIVAPNPEDEAFAAPMVATYSVWAYCGDPDAEYRLTLEFVENPDGTGERYTLRLRLKF